jgi:hypothetical protein
VTVVASGLDAEAADLVVLEDIFGNQLELRAALLQARHADQHQAHLSASAWTTPCWLRCNSGRHSVHVVATSVIVEVAQLLEAGCFQSVGFVNHE